MSKTVIKTAFKVTNKDQQSICASSWIFPLSIHRDLWRVQYKIDQLVYPNVKGTKLLAFKNLECAVKFCRYWYFADQTIYECFALNPKTNGPIGKNANIDEIWKKYNQKKKYTHLNQNHRPIGTLWCDAIQLIRKVEILYKLKKN